jgi:two-component system response regulator YesN
MIDRDALSVLIADDDPDARDVLAEVLELMLPGIRTFLAADGLEAVAVAADVCPWAVILDLGMPRLGGVDAAQRLLDRMGRERPILIAISGDYKRLREGYGVFDYSLRKPLDVHRLARYLSRAMVFPQERGAIAASAPAGAIRQA